MNENEMPRRRFLKAGSVLAIIPLVAASGGAVAATNASLRTSLKYQGKPEGDKNCANCAQFVPGPTKELGGCKIIPGDTEISPQGYCIAWTKKA